eukprot:5889304-Amphidinium_carterae.1
MKSALCSVGLFGKVAIQGLCSFFVCVSLRCRTAILAPFGMASIPSITLLDGRNMQKLALGLYNVPREKVHEIDISYSRGQKHYSSIL